MSHLSEAILHNTNGAVLSLHDASIAALLRDHVDFFVIDAAARPFEAEMVQQIVHAARDVPVLLRVANSTAATLQDFLNCGVDGLILTDIMHAADAEKAIASCLYPPEGIRHYRAALTAQQPSLQALNDQITLIVEIASPLAVTQIDEICEVTGINGILVSPTRLAIAMEEGFSCDSDTVQAALRQLHVAAKGYELPFGLEGAGFDADADFTLHMRDADLLLQGLERVSGLVASEKMMTSQLDDNVFTDDEPDSGLHLVARR